MDETHRQIDELNRMIQQIEQQRAMLGEDVALPALARLHSEVARLGQGQAPAPAPAAQLSDALDPLEAILSARSVTISGDAQGNVIITGDGNTISLPPDQVPPAALLRAYYRSLAAECSRLPLGLVDPEFAAPGGENRLALKSVYTDLDVVSPPRDEEESHKEFGLRLARGESGQRTPLLQAITHPEVHQMALLGDPGSGKTTFVNYLAALAADPAAELPEALQNLLPVRIVLRNAAACIPAGAQGGSECVLWDALHSDMAERLGAAAAEKTLPYLQERLYRQGGLVLLDGLDEVPEAGLRRRCLLEAVQAWVAALAQPSRFVITARPYAYADPQWQLPGFQILALAPFDEDQVNGFIERWYTAVRPSMGWDASTAADKARQLSRALQERPYLADLASRPLLLTLMSTLHTHRGKLPEDRADLYEGSVNLLLSRWQVQRQKKDQNGQWVLEPGIERVLGLGETRLRRALETLAFETHQRQRGEPAGREAAAQQAPADIPLNEVLAAFSKLLPEDLNPRLLVEYLENRAGLLVERREGVYTFLHRSFQEYLAACHLANSEKEFAARLKQLVIDDLDWWREVFLLGVGKTRQGSLSNAIALVNHLVPRGPAQVNNPSPTHWRMATLAAQAALELRLPERAGGDELYDALLERLQAWLVALLEGARLPPLQRLEAGDALGLLGDPRPGVGVLRRGEITLPDIAWAVVPAGPFILGSDKSDRQAYDDERPAHRLELPLFYMARYPLTNAQYRPFIESGGYAQEKYWTAEGWAWRQGAEADLSPLNDKDLLKNYREWLANRPAEKRSQPYFWDDPRRSLPNRPLAGVSWYEAVAYCRWLDERLKEQASAGAGARLGQAPPEFWQGLASGELSARLPSEAEWEKAASWEPGRAAKGRQRRFPWGDDFDPDKANTKESGLGQTSPVGLFPGGASPCGCLDLSGNVWEWTLSRWGRTSIYKPDYSYPYNPQDGRQAPGGPDLRIVRGGSWYQEERSARCAYRFRNIPDDFNSNNGFRVVVSLACSGF